MADASDPMRNVLSETAVALQQFYVPGDGDSPKQTGKCYPRAEQVVETLTLLLQILLPGRFSACHGELAESFASCLDRAWEVFRPELERAVQYRWLETARKETLDCSRDVQALSMQIGEAFFSALPSIREALIYDIEAAYAGDPAAHSYAEVILSYPGVLAIASHRLAHKLYCLEVPILPRIMSEWTHTQTGADIHPGARIGKGFFIDHPTGVVIGETARIGNSVKFYQGVTIGAKSFSLDDAGNPVKYVQRHPTVEDHVVVYANATILGGDTVIGEGSTIGGNVFLMDSVPPKSFVISQGTAPKVRSAG